MHSAERGPSSNGGAASERDSRWLLLGQIANEVEADVAAGRAPDVEALAARHPELAGQIRQLVATLGVVNLLGQSPASASDAVAGFASCGGRLGDFQIVREIGRGGMGVVYEALQNSLARRVALKVLPLAGVFDPRQLARFKNEAQAAAGLHHAHIVPVFAVGCDRGVHFYAMQFIEGRSLAEVIEDLLGARADPRSLEDEHHLPTEHQPAAPARELRPEENTDFAASEARGRASTQRAIVGSTLPAVHTPDFFRTVAQLGVAAAEALEHAHGSGVIHRDIKPANLMLDARGHLWLTDFGLARFEHGASLTLTGDLMGTLRYMSPEQALAQRGLVDQRSDIYSLGATLYELATLNPVFAGQDRRELLRQIANEDPRPPRRWARTLPAELQTILLTALEKAPSDRFATAQDMADDLRRFLDDRPIRARKPTFVQRVKKWSRRHKPAVAAGLVCLLALVAAVTGSVGWSLRDRAARSSIIEAEVVVTLREARRLCDEGRFSQALVIAGRAAGMLASSAQSHAANNQGVPSHALRGEINKLLRELKLAERLDNAAIVQTDEVAQQFQTQVAQIEAGFFEYGIVPTETEIPAAAESIQACPSAVQLVLISALDQWINLAPRAPERQLQRAWLVSLVVLADRDPWRTQVRQALEKKAWPELAGLAGRDDALLQTPYTLGFLGQILAEKPESRDAGIELLLRAQRQYPGDFWLNIHLGTRLAEDARRSPEAVRFATAAAVLRPESAATLGNLGWVLKRAGRLEEAILFHRRAIQLGGASHGVHCSLGDLLVRTGAIDEAIIECQRAIELDPDCPFVHDHLGLAYLNGDPVERRVLDLAIAEFKRVIALKPDHAGAHNNLGVALRETGAADQGLTEFKRAIELSPDLAEAHRNLADLYRDQRMFVESIAHYRQLLRLQPEQADAHCHLGYALLQEGEFTEALDELTRGHQLGSRDPKWDYPSAGWVATAERLLELDSDLPDVLAGRNSSASPAEAAEYADVCYRKKLFASSVRLYAQAFSGDAALAADFRAGRRYAAARSAALAAAGEGAEAAGLDAIERGRLRSLALDWLGADLSAWTEQLATGESETCTLLAQTLSEWRRDPALARVRDAELMGALSEHEQKAWRDVWTRVAELAETAGARAAGLAERGEPTRPVVEITISDATALEGGQEYRFTDAFVPPDAYGLAASRNIVIGADERIYVASQDTDSVKVFAGDTGAYLGDFTAAPGVLDGPRSITFGPDGYLYVAGNLSDNVLRFDVPTGEYDVFVDTGSNGLDGPMLAFGPDGHLYVSSTTGSGGVPGPHQVFRFEGPFGSLPGAPLPAPGKSGAIFVDDGAGNLSNSGGLAFGPDGQLYVCSTFRDEIVRYDRLTGDFIDSFASVGSGGLDTPSMLEFRDDGFLYVASQSTRQVLRYDASDGSFQDMFVDMPTMDTRTVYGFAFSASGELYVSAGTSKDHRGSSVRRYASADRAAFSIRLSKASAVPVTVSYATTDGTALAGSDYAPATGVLTFAPGETIKTVMVVTLDDAVGESREAFTLELSSAVGGTLRSTSAKALVRDNDAS